MSYSVYFIELAENDLLRIHEYVVRHFSENTASEVYAAIRNSILLLEETPNLGRTIPLLTELGMTTYRYMVVEEQNKVIYEIDENKQEIYVHLICSDRQDFDAFLIKRLLEM